jgi:C1A family cysteine protease
MQTRKGLGWKKDRPDDRDVRLMLPPFATAHRPPVMDYRKVAPDLLPYDQGDLGSCTGNGIAGLYEFDLILQKCPRFTPSRLMVYWNERFLEDTVNEDSGAEIRDGIKSIARWGVCPESMWPYDISRFIDKPDQACYDEALRHQAIIYRRVTPRLNTLRAALAAGFPVTFGTEVYESFESDQTANTGIVTLPEPGEAMVGGHCMDLWGYDDGKGMFLVRNSGGTGWGEGGYCWMPYPYVVSEMTSDFWTLRRIEG